MIRITLLVALMALSASAPAWAQDPQAVVVAQPAAEDWHRFSGSASTSYFVEVTEIPAPGAAEVTVRMARVPTDGDADDLSHSIERIAFRCAAGEMKIGETVEYGADGAEADRYDDGLSWEDVPPDSVMAYLKSFACDNMRSTATTYPSIQAFIEGGRCG